MKPKKEVTEILKGVFQDHRLAQDLDQQMVHLR